MNRQQLSIRFQQNTKSHKPNAETHRALINETCRQINAELDLVELIERTAHTIETSIDELIVKNETAPAYVREQYEQLHRAHTRLSFLVSAIQPKKLEAAE